jgi:alpha-L-arabinofuranosidase
MFTSIGRGMSFGKSGAFGSKEAGFVRVWGNIVKLDPDDVRIRPGYLCLQAVNNVVGGDLLETVHEGPQPKFSFTGPFPSIRHLGGEGTEVPPETYKGLPLLFSYAFAEGSRRGIVLVNLKLSEPHNVRLAFSGGVAGKTAERWWIDARDPADNNELEHEARVHLRKDRLRDFADGVELSIPPHSLVVLRWTRPEEQQ